MDKLNLPSTSPSPKHIASLHNSPKLQRSLKPGSSPNNNNNSNNISSTNNNAINDNNSTNLDWVKEETEWEQCSVNPEIARYVKTRNLLERNRLKTLSTQLDKQLERELKRLSLERQEFSDVLENLRKLRGRVEKFNVRRSNRRRGFLYQGHEDEPINLLFAKQLDLNKHSSRGSYESGPNYGLPNEMRGSVSHVTSFPDLLYSRALGNLKYQTPAIRVEQSDSIALEDRAEDEGSVSVGSDTQSCRSQPISAYWAPYERSRITNSASSNASSTSSNRFTMKKSRTGERLNLR